MKRETWYAEHQIDWQPGVRATKIDVKNNFVATEEGRELPFDKLLIATGGEVNLLSDDLRGVCYFRTLDDADRIDSQLRELRASAVKDRRAAVLGGGFISFEFINLFKHYEISTSVVMRAGGFFSKIISPASRNILASTVVEAGMDMVTEATSIDLRGTKELEGVQIGDRAIPTKMLGIGIGLEADLGLVRQAGIEVGRGVLCNDFLETNVPNVYTAGDVAEYFDDVAGRQVMVGNWMNATMQGRAVGKTMAGERTKFELVSSYATKLLDLDVIMIGDVSREHADEVVQNTLTEKTAIELFNRGDATVGAVLIGTVKERAGITQAIKERKNYVA